jgi:glycosyltransferase involved in cell wall biosynthesis
MLLVQPDDHRALARLIDSLLADPARLSSLARAARATVERSFTWRHCGEATLDAYRGALTIAAARRGAHADRAEPVRG